MKTSNLKVFRHPCNDSCNPCNDSCNPCKNHCSPCSELCRGIYRVELIRYLKKDRENRSRFGGLKNSFVGMTFFWHKPDFARSKTKVNDEQNIVIENELLRRGFTSIPNYIFGMPISSNAKLIYMALLSYAWNNRYCYPGLAKLCTDVSLSDKPVTKAIEELTQSALLEVRRRGQGKTNIYIIKDFSGSTAPSNPSDSRISKTPILESEILRIKNRQNSETKTGKSPTLESENLRNPTEEKYTEEKRPDEKYTPTHKSAAARVCVGSKFTLEECRRYAAHLNATGQGIKNPGGYATTIHRSGEVDEFIQLFLNPPVEVDSSDSSNCPDCQGTGFWYPKGIEHGVAKCKHKQLQNDSRNSEGPLADRKLAPERITEQAAFIAELLESGYTLAQAQTQFASGLHPDDWNLIREQALRYKEWANKDQL